jgi:HEAT repeat protein
MTPLLSDCNDGREKRTGYWKPLQPTLSIKPRVWMADRSHDPMNKTAPKLVKEEKMTTTALGSDKLTVPQLIEQLKARDRSARLQAAAVLGRLGRKARPAVPALIEALQDEDVHVRRLAALALGDLGADSPAAVAALMEALHDKHPGVRRRAAVALGEIGGGAAAAVRDLVQSVDDRDQEVGRMAAWAAEMIGRAVRRVKAA